MNSNQKKLRFYAYFASLGYFISQVGTQLPQLGDYEGWRFYAFLTGFLMNLTIVVVGIWAFKRVKKATWDAVDSEEA